MTSDAVRVCIEAPRASITLSNPDRRNALSLATMTGITAALRSLSADPGAQVIVIDAEGPAFSAGHDMSEMIDRPARFYDELFAACAELMQTIHDVPQPVVAKVDGIATAAGCQLVASCDLVVASDTSSFATPGVRIGLFCSTPMVPISRAVGRKRAMEMLLTGEPITADTAADWGLVNRVVPRAELDAAVDDLVARITRFSRATIAVGKEAFHRQIDMSEPDAYDYTRTVMAANAADDNAQEGIGAFLDKRNPVWPS